MPTGYETIGARFTNDQNGWAVTTVGAVFGVGVGFGIAQIVAAVSPMPAAVAPLWIAIGVGLGLTVGVIAGVYPASRASKLDPVDALRYE